MPVVKVVPGLWVNNAKWGNAEPAHVDANHWADGIRYVGTNPCREMYASPMSRRAIPCTQPEQDFPWMPKWANFVPVGSRVTCNPPPIDTDCDWLVLDDQYQGVREMLLYESDFMESDEDEYAQMEDFCSLRKGEHNVIICYDKGFYNSFLKATDRAKELNLLDKKDRVKLFNNIMYLGWE